MKVVTDQGISIDRLPSLAQVFAAIEPEPWAERAESTSCQRPEWSWNTAIAAMAVLLRQETQAEAETERCVSKVCDAQGVIFCGPTPVFSDLAVLAHFKTWVFTPENRTYAGFQLPPAVFPTVTTPGAQPNIPIPKGDGLANEQFCLIQTRRFAWVASLGPNEHGLLQFRFSFEPATVEKIWQFLQLRIDQGHLSVQGAQIRKWRSLYPVIEPNYKLPMQFGQELLRQSTLFTPSVLRSDRWTTPGTGDDTPKERASYIKTVSCTDTPNRAQVSELEASFAPEDRDVELLKVLAHEVRTPLATIQTLTRLLLKRSDLPQDVIKRLESIQKECSGQIDRFGLIFRAMELTHDGCQALPNRLTPLSLREVLEENLTRWQAHAARRNLTFELSTPKQLPAIAIRDPHLFDLVLTGLMEYLSYSLRPGCHIHLQVALAGAQLKLELKTQGNTKSRDTDTDSPILQAVGQLLMFQPETGGLSLSLPATKHLFQALGGKLTVRKHQDSEVLTLFLPLGTDSEAY